MQASRTALWLARRRLSQVAAQSAVQAAPLPLASTSTAAARGYYLATLPWSTAAGPSVSRAARLNPLQAGEAPDSIVASSLSSSRRTSPLYASLASPLPAASTLPPSARVSAKGSAASSDSAWLLLRASSEADARSIVQRRCAPETWDVGNVSVQSVAFGETLRSGGPLYMTDAQERTAGKSQKVDTSGPLYGK